MTQPVPFLSLLYFFERPVKKEPTVKIRSRLITIPIILLSLSFSSCSTTYLGRYISWNQPDIYDYQNFPARSVKTGPATYEFSTSREAEQDFLNTVVSIRYRTETGIKEQSLEHVLETNETTVFLVIQNDTVLYEKYFNGFSRESVCTSFSISKSLTSALIGIAIEDGLIGSLDDPVTEYIPELKDRGMDTITIRHLLTMSSGLRHDFTNALWSDAAKSYFSPDLRKNALRKIKVIEEPDRHFTYNNCHTQLLGMILERTSGMTVSAYMEEKLWIPLETEFPAAWSLDSEKSGFETMAMGFNARPLDFARFGRLYLNGGNWNGNRIINPEWIRESTETDSNRYGIEGYYPDDTENVFGEYFGTLDGYYSYSWWGYRIDETRYDFFAFGILGQYIYICPEKNLLILRFGEGYGDVYWWPEVLKDISDRL